MMMPLIWYQKLQLISAKYMYIIDKYGYLTTKEQQQLLEEMKQSGFDTNYITISAPKTKQTYGKLIEMEIGYVLKHTMISFKGKSTKNLTLTVKKYSFSKI